MVFELEISKIDNFRNLIKSLSVIVEEGCFNLGEDQMGLLAMDPSHVAMVDFELPKEAFGNYLCEKEKKLSINITEFLRFIDRVERDEYVKIWLNEEAMKLVIECSRGGHMRQFMMPLLEPEEDEVPSPKIFFKADARILTQSLKRVIRDAGIVSEHVKFEIAPEEFKISAEGDMGSAMARWDRKAEDLLELKAEEKAIATFTLSYLQDIINAASVSSEVVTLELSSDMPIKLNFELPQGRLMYYLAPCIGV
jgi:proliferating cell nuclear antigen